MKVDVNQAMKRTYAIIGLGKLGASMAAAIASRGFHVIGVDVNRRSVDLINAGRAPVQETNLEETIAANRQRIRATQDMREAVLHTDIAFVIVPTPSDQNGAFSLTYAAEAFRHIGRALAEKETYYTVVLTSTVLPGATRHGLLPLLEAESGKIAGRDFGLCYGPEFIALGSVIHDFLHPDFTLVGEYDKKSGDLLESCYAQILPDHPDCQRMSLENAELTKLAVNTYVTMKITFANTIAALCEQVPGGDVDVVTRAVGRDRRIGGKYLTGGLGYGGPCFPRDNLALSYFARTLGRRAELAETTDAVNRSVAINALERLEKELRPGSTVAVLGLAYKPHSHLVEESQGILLAHGLANSGYRVLTYDPLAHAMTSELARNAHLNGWLLGDSLQECLDEADAVLVTTPDPAFKTLDATNFARLKRTVTVVDFWRILSGALEGHPHIRYVPFGRSIRDREHQERLAELWRPEMEEVAV
ncbi:MAG: nucleotide sugar dehydrogenase [Acidobacteriaceae bacterium]|nr:nucleotide sugar dehydrogenase [Acidobacteriaceae bacterium]